MDDGLLIPIGLAGGLIGYGISWISQIKNRYTLKKALTKKDYIILSIVNLTTGIEDEYIVERNADIIEYKENTWISKGAKYYLRLEPDKFSEKGAAMARRNGLPILYVSADDYLPIGMRERLEGQAISPATPKSINSSLRSLIMHNTAKRVSKFFDVIKVIDMKLWIVMGLIAVCIFITWNQGQDMHKLCGDALNATIKAK